MAFRFGPFRLDARSGSISRDGVPVPLQPKALDLLACLVSEPGRVWSREELSAVVWPDVRVGEDALTQAFRRVRRALGEEVDPPRWIETVPRRGWRFIGTVEEEAGPDDGAFFGRDEDLRRLETLLAEHGRAVVHGAAGVGKTRLVEAWLGARVHLRVDLRGAAPEDLERLLAASMGVPTEGGDVPTRIHHALAGRAPTIVLLDDADGVAAVLPCWVTDWTRIPGVQVLATSRVVVDGLPRLALEPLPRAASRALLGALLAAGRPGWAPTEAEEPALDALIAAVDDLPLGVELLAARLRVLSPAEILSASALGAAEGRTLRRTLDLAWRQLDPVSAAVLAASADLPGPFTAVDAAAAVGSALEPVVDALVRLHDASLVRRVADGFDLLETVRTYAAEQLQAAGGVEETRDRWADTLLARTEGPLAGFFRWDMEAAAALGRFKEPLLQAWRRQPIGSERSARLGLTLAAACRYGGPWSLAREVLEQVVAAGRDDAVVWALLGEYRIRGGDAPGAVAALAHVPASGWPAAHAHFLSARLLVGGDPAAARVEAQSAAALAVAARHLALEALSWDAAGLASATLGDEAGTRSAYHAAMAAARTTELAGLRGIVTQNFGASLGRLGRHDDALPWFLRAVEDVRRIPFPHLRATTLGNLGMALLHTGRVAEARPLLEEAWHTAIRVGDRWSERIHGGNLGLALLEAGAVEEARAPITRAASLADTPAERAQAHRWVALLSWGGRPAGGGGGRGPVRARRRARRARGG